MTRKWSDSSSEGRLMARIIVRLSKKEKVMPENPKLADLTNLAKTIAYVAEKKSNLAKNSDWEERIVRLEKMAMLAPIKEEPEKLV